MSSFNSEFVPSQVGRKNQRFTRNIETSFNLDDGPCIKSLQSCLKSLGVCRQRYFGGIFVGNHVHKILKVFFVPYENAHQLNVEVLCSCVLKATEHVSELKADANDIYMKFSTIML